MTSRTSGKPDPDSDDEPAHGPHTCVAAPSLRPANAIASFAAAYSVWNALPARPAREPIETIHASG